MWRLSGSISITLDLPDDFGVSDRVMIKIVQSTARVLMLRRSSSYSLGCIRTKCDNPDLTGSPRSLLRQHSNRFRRSGGSRGMSQKSYGPSHGKYQQHTPFLPLRRQYKATPPCLTPESRQILIILLR